MRQPWDHPPVGTFLHGYSRKGLIKVGKKKIDWLVVASFQDGSQTLKPPIPEHATQKIFPSPNGRWLGESHINNPIIISPNDSPFGGFPKLEVPHYGCFIMENPFKVDDLGAPPTLEKPTPAVSPCDAEKKRASGLPNHTVELRPH